MFHEHFISLESLCSNGKHAFQKQVSKLTVVFFPAIDKEEKEPIQFTELKFCYSLYHKICLN